jgi:hypothetical protein
MILISNQRVQDENNEIKEQKLKRELRDWLLFILE